MIGLEYVSRKVMEELCEECKGIGKIIVYRHDLEEFVEFECPNQKLNKE